MSMKTIQDENKYICLDQKGSIILVLDLSQLVYIICIVILCKILLKLFRSLRSILEDMIEKVINLLKLNFMLDISCFVTLLNKFNLWLYVLYFMK